MAMSSRMIGRRSFPVYVIAVGSAFAARWRGREGKRRLVDLRRHPRLRGLFNYPLLETGRTRLAASRYGLFVEGLGVLNWQAVERLDLIPVVVRAISYRELELMRQPASVTSRNTIRIPLEIFDCPARDIYESFVRVGATIAEDPSNRRRALIKTRPTCPLLFPISRR